MKVIYMEQTLNLMAKINSVESVNELVKTGQIKQTETINYLITQ
jgi:hypothetical protein